MSISRHTSLPILALALGAVCLATAPLPAQDRPARQDSTRVLDRLDPDRAERTLVTREGDVALLIHGTDLIVQLTDRGLDELRVPKEEEDEEESFTERLIGSMLRAGLRQLLDHSLAYPIAELARAEVVGERLVLENREGEELFDMTVNDRELLEDFDLAEAGSFARALRSRMTVPIDR